LGKFDDWYWQIGTVPTGVFVSASQYAWLFQSEKVEILSGYAVSDFYPCMEQLLETFKKAPNCPQQAAREKFSNTK